LISIMFDRKELLAIEETPDRRSDGQDPQDLPSPMRHLDVLAFNAGADAMNELKELDVILVRVGPKEIKVPLILITEYDARRLVLPPGNRLELHLCPKVAIVRAFEDNTRPPFVGRLLS